MKKNNELKKEVENLEKDLDNIELLVTFKEGKNGFNSEIKGMEEIELALKHMKSYYIKETEFYNSVIVDLIDDPVEAVQLLRKTPTEAIKKAVPIDTVISSVKDNIIKAAIEISANKIAKKESFSVKCEFRSKFPNYVEDVINKVPSEVCRNLNLKYNDNNPDWMILIEEMGTITGIAIRRPDEILIKG